MTRTRLRMLEIATWWMPVYMLIFMAFWLFSMLSMAGAPALGHRLSIDPTVAGGAVAAYMISFGILMVLHVATMLLTFALMGIYAMLAMQTPSMDRTEQLLWALLVILGGPIGQLLFLYKILKPATLQAPDSRPRPVVSAPTG